MDQTVIIGLYLDDFSLLNKITRKIKSKEFTLRHIKNISRIDNEITVVISKDYVVNCKIPQVQPKNLEILELRIRCAFYNLCDLIVGIDPGGTIGIAIVGGNRLLFQNEFKNIRNLVQIMKSIQEEIGLSMIRIGTGSPPERNQIVRSLEKYSDVIKHVNESRSGSGSHTAAATRIALRRGNLENPPNYEPRAGEIAWIQQESRRLSKGLVTIDKQLAHQILVGNLIMSDAIKTYTNKIKI
jgi:hypothetical protein